MPLRAVTRVNFSSCLTHINAEPALRFPRIARIRTDKPAAEADRLESLMRLVENAPLAAVG